VRVLEGVGHVVLSGTLVNVEHPDVHRNRDGTPEEQETINSAICQLSINFCDYALELYSLSQRVPSKEGRRVRDLPHFMEAVAVVVRSGPVTLLQICGPKRKTVC
jgi:hypothetical protein